MDDLSPSNPSLDCLPLVVYDIIFDHLHLINLARLKRVCKRLRGLVLDYRVRELLVSSSEYSYNFLDPFNYSDPGEFQNSCIVQPSNCKRMLPFRIRTHPTGNSMFDPQTYSISSTVHHFSAYTILLRCPQFNVRFLKSLTYCYTHWDQWNYLTFDEVNQLVQLERLEIEFRTFPNHFPNHATLSLPNLKTLLLNSFEDYNFTMQVEAPRCESFHLSCEHEPFHTQNNQAIQIYFTQPHSVKHLSLGHYHESSHLFRNLEFLQIVGRAQLIGRRTFSAFPRLKTLKIIEHDSLDGFRQLWRLCQQRNVKLVVHGIRLLNGRELDFFIDDRESQDPVRIWGMRSDRYDLVFNRLVDNYDKLEDDLNFVRKLVFSQRIAGLLQADADRFLRKFHNLYQVSSRMQIERPKLFFRLLSSQRNLGKLSILYSGMHQEHFDQLANVKTLYELQIEEGTKVNLSFATKLPVLSHLTTNHHVDLLKELRFDEIMNRKVKLLTVRVKRGENLLEIIKHFDGPTPRRNYTYVLAKSDPGETTIYHFPAYQDGIWPIWPNNECFKSVDGLVRRYEEIRNEDNWRYKERAWNKNLSNCTIPE